MSTSETETVPAPDTTSPYAAKSYVCPVCNESFAKPLEKGRHMREQGHVDPEKPPGTGHRKRGRGSRDRAASAPPRSSPSPARSHRAKPRGGSMQPMLGAAWSGIGFAVENLAPEPVGPPVGRCLQFQAPYAASQLHPLLRQLPVYRRMDESVGGSLQALAALVAPPILVGLIASNPVVMFPMVAPVLHSLLYPIALEAAKAKREQVKALEEIGEYADDANEMMQQLLDQMFARKEDAGDNVDDGYPVPSPG